MSQNRILALSVWPARPKDRPGRLLPITEGGRCQVTIGGKRTFGTVVEALPKSYRVLLDGSAQPQRLAAKKVKPHWAPTIQEPTSSTLPMEPASIPRIELARRSEPSPLQPVPRPDPPELCPAWLEQVRVLSCCSCARPAPSEAHHEGKKGVGQRVRDTLAVPLCSRCHRVYTDTNCLPDLTRAQSLDLLQTTQDQLLSEVFKALSLACRVETMSKIISRQDRGIIEPAFRPLHFDQGS